MKGIGKERERKGIKVRKLKDASLHLLNPVCDLISQVYFIFKNKGEIFLKK